MIDLICDRRSVRSGFTRDPVPPAIVEEIVRCGLSAPSSKNAQPWRIHVVTDEAILDEIAETVSSAKHADSYVPIDPRTGENRPEMVSTVAESAEVLRAVPLALFVENTGAFSAGRSAVANAEPAKLENALVGYGFEMVGMGASIQSMWLAAHYRNLAGVFMGDVVIAETFIRDRLGMDGDLVGVLALGKSSDEPFPKKPDGIVRVVRHRRTAPNTGTERETKLEFDR